MSHPLIGLIGFIIIVVLILMGTNLAFTLVIAGLIGFTLVGGWTASLANLAILPFERMTNYSFTVFPMFMLMGSLVSYGGIGDEAYKMAKAWFGHVKGGLAVATIGACGLFAAVQGTSLAGSLVMGKVSYPEMRKAGYSMPLAAGVISVGGTLGILIPPSMGFIMIGIMADMNIGQLFMAGIIPGVIVCALYMTTIFLFCKFRPSLAPTLPKAPWKERWGSVRLTWPVVALFLLVMGGIYGGVFTATEAGAIGAFGAFVIAIVKRKLTRQAFANSLWDTAKMMGMIIAVLAGVFIFNAFLAITQLPTVISDFMIGLPFSRWFVLIIILVFYIILGMFFDVLSILILTIPILYPAIQAMGFDLIWYSVIMVRIIEMGEISPPFGINLFGLKGVIDAPLGQIYRGVIPFLIADVVSLIIFCCFPVLSTYLPYTMMK
jgi:tripartite ATP-independent transporter DctM subunit